MKKLYIWGAGEIGNRIRSHLSNSWDIIFVDSNIQLESRYCHGRRIIGIEDYLKKYSDEFILVAHLSEDESVEILHRNNLVNYFIHCDLPGEFKEPFIRDCLEQYVTNYLGKRKDYILYGLNLYSIVIDDWLNREFGIHPNILIQDEVSELFIEKVKNKFGEINLINDINHIKGIKEICICFNDNRIQHKKYFLDKFLLTNIFDCSDKIESYYNPAIEKFHNIHQGQRCFIVATGPSLRMEDLDSLKQNKVICISMNSIFYAFGKTDWRPDYYVMSDYRGFSLYKDLLDSLPIKYKFLSDNSELFWKIPHEENIYCYHQHYEYCFDRLPKFSDNFSLRSYSGATVTYTCLQLAVYMGFTEIYLLGVDFSYGENESNKEYSHFYKEKEAADAVGFAKHVRLAYEAASTYTQKHGIRVYNATRGGKLEIFERVDFDSIFD